uniref:Uncharacterized protein n=1 Tax=Arion vulgaris TaxID=1028688 RepID=A0A0B7ASF6_9EUPU
MQREAIPSELLGCFNVDLENVLAKLVTGDKTCTYYLEPETKEQSMDGIISNHHEEKNLKTSSARKVMCLLEH